MSGAPTIPDSNTWLEVVVIVVLALAACLAAAATYGALRWEGETRALRTRLATARVRIEPRVFDVRELEGLRAAVQRYFHVALKEGQPIVAAASVEHAGTFNMSETAERWRPFTSMQRVVTRRPGFDWDGRIAAMPGVPVRVHDAYVAGQGVLHAALTGDPGEHARHTRRGAG